MWEEREARNIKVTIIPKVPLFTRNILDMYQRFSFLGVELMGKEILNYPLELENVLNI